MHHFEFKANDYLIPQYYGSLQEVFQSAYEFYRYSNINDASTLKINLVNYGTIYATGDDYPTNRVRILLDHRCVGAYSDRFKLTAWIAIGSFQQYIDLNLVYLHRVCIFDDRNDAGDVVGYSTTISYRSKCNNPIPFDWMATMPILPFTELNLLSDKSITKIDWQQEGF